ncbi:hypothetical protein GJD97_22405 [Escherichia coli]|nr:hypothetical protein [Escherichia coli]QGK01700.1 hypothetical protein GJD97_22405 [Escherichia coli]
MISVLAVSRLLPEAAVISFVSMTEATARIISWQALHFLSLPDIGEGAEPH